MENSQEQGHTVRLARQRNVYRKLLQEKRADRIQRIIERSGEIDCNQTFETVLHGTLEGNLLAVSEPELKNLTLLAFIVVKEWWEMIPYLLDKGANPDTLIGKECTVLENLIANEQYDQARLLCEKGANPNGIVNGKQFNAPLFRALFNDSVNKDFMKFLCEKGADINKIIQSKNDEGEITLAYAAIQLNKKDIFQFLVEDLGADLNCGDLHPACVALLKDKDTELSRWLLQFYDPNIIVNKKLGNTILHESSVYDTQFARELLLSDQKLDVNVKNAIGYTALHIVATLGQSLSLVKLLIERMGENAFLNCDEQGNTPLHLAAFSNSSIVKTIDKGMKDMQEATKEGILKKEVRESSFEKTHKRTFKFDKPDFPNFFSPSVKISGARQNIVKNLLTSDQGKAALFHKNKNGDIPLHIAVREPEQAKPDEIKVIKRIVTYLISQGADLNIKNNEGATPLSEASEKMREAMLQAAQKRDEVKAEATESSSFFATPKPSAANDVNATDDNEVESKMNSLSIA